MMSDAKVKNSRELEFAVLCIEDVAEKLGVDAERVYQAEGQEYSLCNV